MKADQAKAIRRTVAGETLYFCPEHCRRAYEGEGRESVAGQAH